MSEVKVNKISPRSGTTVTLGDSGDTFTLASGVSLTGVNATFSGDLTVDTDTLYVDSANNSVGIGTTSPSEKLEVNGNIRVGVGSETAPSLQIGDNDTGIFDAGANAIGFTTAGTEKVRIVSGGSVAIGATSASQKLHVEGSIYTSGSLYVGGTGSANALDDYERGTWTPDLDFATSSTGSLNYTGNTGYYVKVGKSVFITAFIQWNANNFTASSGGLQCKGLPFTTSSAGSYRGGVAVTFSSNPWTGVTVYQQAFRTESNQPVLQFNFSDGTDGNIDSSITSHTNIQSSGSFMISGTYVVD